MHALQFRRTGERENGRTGERENGLGLQEYPPRGSCQTMMSRIVILFSGIRKKLVFDELKTVGYIPIRRSGFLPIVPTGIYRATQISHRIFTLPLDPFGGSSAARGRGAGSFSEPLDRQRYLTSPDANRVQPWRREDDVRCVDPLAIVPAGG